MRGQRLFLCRTVSKSVSPDYTSLLHFPGVTLTSLSTLIFFTSKPLSTQTQIFCQKIFSLQIIDCVMPSTEFVCSGVQGWFVETAHEHRNLRWKRLDTHWFQVHVEFLIITSLCSLPIFSRAEYIIWIWLWNVRRGHIWGPLEYIDLNIIGINMIYNIEI